jgi:hypothetical protein
MNYVYKVKYPDKIVNLSDMSESEQRKLKERLSQRMADTIAEILVRNRAEQGYSTDKIS